MTGSSAVAVASFEVGVEDAADDNGQDEVATAVGSLRSSTRAADPRPICARRAESRSDVPVRQRALDGEGLLARRGCTIPPLSTPRRPSTCSVGQWLRLQQGALARRACRPRGSSRAAGSRAGEFAIGDGFDIHGRKDSRNDFDNQQKCLIYMATLLLLASHKDAQNQRLDPLERKKLRLGGGAFTLRELRPNGRHLKCAGGPGRNSNLQPDRYERPALTIELPARGGAPRHKAQIFRGRNAAGRSRSRPPGVRNEGISPPRRSPPAAPPRFARR